MPISQIQSNAHLDKLLSEHAVPRLFNYRLFVQDVLRRYPTFGSADHVPYRLNEWDIRKLDAVLFKLRQRKPVDWYVLRWRYSVFSNKQNRRLKCTRQQIGEIMGCTRERVAQRERRAFTALWGILFSFGYSSRNKLVM